MPTQPRSITSVNQKIQKMIKELDDDEGTKNFIRLIIEVELQNLDKERAIYINDYENIFNEYLIN
jgi:hypothetical protein